MSGQACSPYLDRGRGLMYVIPYILFCPNGLVVVTFSFLPKALRTYSFCIKHLVSIAVAHDRKSCSLFLQSDDLILFIEPKKGAMKIASTLFSSLVVLAAIVDQVESQAITALQVVGSAAVLIPDLQNGAVIPLATYPNATLDHCGIGNKCHKISWL
jgi:hypothetical protein